MRLEGAPAVPRILWDNREHQFWEEFEGSFEPRNVVVNAPKVEQVKDTLIRASYYYIANHVKTTMTCEFTPPAQVGYRANWTTIIEVENRTSQTLRNYIQFFACYHKAATNYYWDDSNQILPCADGRFTVSRDEKFNALLRSSPYTVHMNRYRENHRFSDLSSPRNVVGERSLVRGVAACHHVGAGHLRRHRHVEPAGA